MAHMATDQVRQAISGILTETATTESSTASIHPTRRTAIARPKRIAFRLAAAGASLLGLLAGSAQSAMASTGAVTTAKTTPMAAASVCGVSTILPHGAYLCGTTEFFHTWTKPVVYAEDIVVGTDFKVYHATLNETTGQVSAWSFLQNGSVLQNASRGSTLGIGSRAVNGAIQIQVLGTTGHYFCNTKSNGGNWAGWTTAGCPQTPIGVG